MYRNCKKQGMITFLLRIIHLPLFARGYNRKRSVILKVRV